MKKEIADFALKFLERVQLNGAEVPAFNAVVAALLEAKIESGKQSADKAKAPSATSR